jgi:enamidase
MSDKLVIKNVGLMLSGDLARPILDADTIVAVDGRIAAVGRRADSTPQAPDKTVDAKGTTVAPG